MQSNILISYILLILFISISCQQPQKKLQIPSNKIGDIIKGINYKVDQGRSFQLIHISSIEKKYLFLTLKIDEIYSHLELSLNIYKEGQQTPLKRCLKSEIDSCYLPKHIITANQTLFIVIESGNEDCEYQLRSYWSDLEHITIGSQTRFMFSRQQQKQIYHLQLEGNQFEELRIIIKPETRRYAFDKIKMYGTFGKDSLPSADHFDFKSTYLWQDAQGIYLNRKDLKQLSINFILIGQVETVYTMNCDLVKKEHNDLTLNSKIYEYLEKDQSYNYHADFKTNGKLDYDLYVLTIAIFSGDLQMEFYKDKQLTQKAFHRQPYMYMGDIQYVLSKDEIQKQIPNGIYLKTKSKNRVTTFMLEIEGRTKSKLFELHQHIYQFTPVITTATSYIKIGKFHEDGSKKNRIDLKVTFSLIQVMGSVSIQFRKCIKTYEQCTGELFLNSSILIDAQYRNVGTKSTYTLSLSDDFWKSVNYVEKNAIIIVVLSNRQKSNSFAAIQYSVGNRPQFLRQNKPIESHILKNELKIYKFVNTDKSISGFKLHINKVSGSFSTYIFRRQPTSSQLTSDSNKISGTLYQTTQIQDPLVVVIRGEDSATYSLVIQPIHKEVSEITYITLSQDVEFKIKIAPNKYEIFEIAPVLNNIYFNYKSSGAVHACALKQNVCQDIQANFTNQGEITRPGFQDRSLYIKLRNPSASKSIQVTMIFHSSRQNHCQLKKIGQLYKQIAQQGSCYITPIDQAQDFEIFIVRQQVGELSYIMALCDKLLNFAIKDDGQRYIVSKEQIVTNCQGHSQNNFLFSVSGGKQNSSLSNLHLKYLVQYTTSKVVLPDGVGYHGTAVTNQQVVKKFVYPILNKVNTSIILSTDQKLFFLVKIINNLQRETATLSMTSYDFSSPSEKFYYLQSIYLKITQEQLKAAKCESCQLLIYLYSKEQVGTIVDWTLQVAQNFIYLEDSVPKSGYLPANSKAYYGIKTKQNGSLLVQISDNNQDCTELYLSSMEYPDQKYHLQKSFDGQIILDVPSNNKNYYITVKSRKNCAFTITAALTQGKNHIVKLQRGKLGYCNLNENQIKFYTFKHHSQRSFKIISLHKYGQVQFYINKTTPESILSLAKKQNINLEEFSYQSDLKNRLTLSKNNKEFCKGCLYILAVKAKKHTESSIFLGDEETKIPLSDQKVLNDVLVKSGSATRAQFYFIEKGVLQMKVHSGKVEVQIVYKQQSIKNTFTKGKELSFYNFKLTAEKGYFESPTVIYTALSDNTIYSSRIKREDIQKNGKIQYYTNIDPNVPNYIYLTKKEKTCVKGYIKRSDERLFLSFSTGSKELRNQLKLFGKVNNNDTNIIRDTTKNIIQLSFSETTNKPIESAVPYQLCLIHQTQSFSVTVMQTQDTSLLPENVQTLVSNKQTFDIYPEGDFILDIFQCSGTTKISYGTTKADLTKNKPKVLDMIGMPDQSHAVRLEQGYSNLLLQVEGKLSLIRWLHIDQQQEKGLGYYLYRAGNIRYNSGFGQIQFLVDPVKQIKKTKTKIESIRYNLYLSVSQQDLKYASQCEKYLPDSVLYFQVNYSQILGSQFKFIIQKNKIMEKYKQQDNNFFYNVVADLILKTPDNTLQQYRFIYKSQQLPAQVFTPNQLQKYDFTTIIVVLILFIISIVVFSCVFAKIVVPLIGRLRNRLLVEENGLETSKDKNQQNQEKMQPPPSSDRQGINFNDQFQTQHKM